MGVVCRDCGQTNVRSLDQYVGTCDGAVEVGPNGELEFHPGGFTEIDWDSCEQTGWQCGECYEFEEAPVDAAGEREPILESLGRLMIDAAEFAKRQAVA